MEQIRLCPIFFNYRVSQTKTNLVFLLPKAVVTFPQLERRSTNTQIILISRYYKLTLVVVIIREVQTPFSLFFPQLLN